MDEEEPEGTLSRAILAQIPDPCQHKLEISSLIGERRIKNERAMRTDTAVVFLSAWLEERTVGSVL